MREASRNQPIRQDIHEERASATRYNTMKKSVAAAIVFCAAATASLCWPAANALPNDCEALDYSGTYTYVVDQVVFYYWGKDGTEEGRLEGYANSTYNVHPVVISAAPPAAGDDAFLLSFNPNETDFLSTEFEAGLCYACNDDTYPVLSCAVRCGTPRVIERSLCCECAYSHFMMCWAERIRRSIHLKTRLFISLYSHPDASSCSFSTCSPPAQTRTS